MRTTIFTTCALACATSVLGQGQIYVNNHVVGSIVSHIYGPNPDNPYLYQSGEPDPIEHTGPDWSGFPLLEGSGYTVQLWGAPGANQPESSLAPAYPTTVMRTGAAAGYVQGTTVTVPNIPGGPNGGPATFVLRVWDNQGGTITSWATAQVSGFASGESPIFNVSGPLGGGVMLPPNVIGLRTFNIHLVPEPSTFALMILGAVSLSIFRSRKRGAF